MIYLHKTLPPDYNTKCWKDIAGYEGLYSVSSAGKIYSRKSEKFMSPKTDKDGYQVVTLVKDGKMRSFYVHRLVAQAFIPNPENKPTVNHLDENKSNNKKSNLQWATISEQVTYGKGAINRNKRKFKPVIIYDRYYNVIGEYPSVQSAAEAIGVKTNILSRHLNHPRKFVSVGEYTAIFKVNKTSISLMRKNKNNKKKGNKNNE